MKSSKTIKFKALFLLVTFSLNSVVGFACSVGVDIGFNSQHHQHEEGEEHSHKDHPGKQGHNHEDKQSHKHSHTDGHKHSHSHDQEPSSADGNTFILKAADDDNCCNDFVVGYQSLDKQLVEKSYSAKAKILSTPFIYQQAFSFKYTGYIKPVRTPPKIIADHSPPDIIVFIQSFLI